MTPRCSLQRGVDLKYNELYKFSKKLISYQNTTNRTGRSSLKEKTEVKKSRNTDCLNTTTFRIKRPEVRQFIIGRHLGQVGDRNTRRRRAPGSGILSTPTTLPACNKDVIVLKYINYELLEFGSRFAIPAACYGRRWRTRPGHKVAINLFKRTWLPVAELGIAL